MNISRRDFLYFITVIFFVLVLSIVLFGIGRHIGRVHFNHIVIIFIIVLVVFISILLFLLLFGVAFFLGSVFFLLLTLFPTCLERF